MILSLCLWLIAALPAQPMALHIDLSGDWRMSRADDARFAEPGFDDSSWAVERVPLSREATYDVRAGYWLRKAVILPGGPERPVLTITIGAVPEPFEFFLNGNRMYRSDPGLMIIPRPRTFRFTAPADLRVVIAIHVRYNSRKPAAWRLFDEGPWLITNAEAAPPLEDTHALAQQKLRRTSDLAQGLILLSLAVVVFLVWSRQSDQSLLLWLSVYMSVVALGRINLYAQISPDPIVAPNLGMLFLGIIPAAVFAQLVSVWTGTKLLNWIAWAVAAVATLTSSASEAPAGAATWFIDSLVLLALGRHAWRQRREALLVAGAVLVVYTHASSWGRIDDLGLPRLVQYNTGGWISFALVWHLFFTTIFGFALTVTLVRRLLQDRDEKLQLAGELEAARTVQQLLLPCVTVPGVEAVYQPAREVGGDFYQILSRDDGSQLVVTGDVSGKGLKAAMLVSVVIGILRNEKASSPALVLDALNRGLAGQTGGGFVTCCCARFAPDGSVTVANAGHLLPYYDGTEVQVESGLPLGLAANVDYAETTVRGSYFVFVSDGVVEAANVAGELFGFERTRAISMQSAEQIAEAAKKWGQNDDITVVTLQSTKTVRRNG